MEKSTKKVTVKPWIWISGSIVLLGSIGIMIWYKKKKAKEEDTEFVFTSSSDSATKPNPSSTTTTGGAFRCEKKSYPLSYGTCHPDVAILQRYLKSLKANIGTGGKARDGVDGKFGRMTQKAAHAKAGKITFNPSDIQGMKRSLNLIKA